MPPSDLSPSAATDTPRAISRRKVVYALSDEARWELLSLLSDGEARMVNDLARRIGKTSSATSKHLKALRAAGIVRMRNRCHQLIERFRPVPGTREIDLGHCVVRFDR